MNAPEKILVIGQLWNGGTCENRRRAVEELGHPTISFDTSSYTTYRNPFWRSLAHRVNIGPPVAALNRDLLDFVKNTVREVAHIWVDKGKWLLPETLRTLRHATGATLIHYTPDAQLLDNTSHHFRSSLPLYDVMFTTKPFELDLYRRHGARHVFLIHQSYDSKRLRPRALSVEDKRRFGADVTFIGHCQPHYAKYLRTARPASRQLRIWGPGWSRYARRHPWARDIVAGDGVWADDYAKALGAACIGLCLLSKRIPETTTTRTFEIPGCGTFMLAERTAHHLELFEEGVEADFFGSCDEMTDKIQFYLSKPSIRKRIANAGYQRCLSSGYSDLQRVRQMLDIVERIQKQPNIAQERPGDTTKKAHETSAA